MVWECPSCRESVDDGFEVCWSCGCSKDGTPDPEFVPVKDVGDDIESVTEPTLEDQFAERFKCVKCDGTQALVERMSATGTGLSKILDVQYKTFLTVSCTKCGYTEFYNADVLGASSRIGNILDILFD